MTKLLHLIYITGLGDASPNSQRWAVSTWRKWGVTSELFQVNWADGEAWQPKFDRLLDLIDSLVADGKAVGLVGASAGAGAAINAFAARKDKIVGVVCISGKVNRPEVIGQGYRKKNPAFVTSAYQVEQSLAVLDVSDRRRILSRYALLDETVYKPDSRIAGARNRIVPTVGHFFTIATQLIFGAPSFIRFLKRQQIA